MNTMEDAAYCYWEFLKYVRVIIRLKEKGILNSRNVFDLRVLLKDELQLSEPAEQLSDEKYLSFLETAYGHDASSCPISSIQARERARQAAHIDSKYVYFSEIVKRRKSELTPSYALQCWLRNRGTVEYMTLWEQENNPKFDSAEAKQLLTDLSASNGSLTLKQWIERTGAKGIITLPGRYGGTYAVSVIASDFEMWLSPRFRLAAAKRNFGSFEKWLEK